jgi:hypothetical protein
MNTQTTGNETGTQQTTQAPPPTVWPTLQAPTRSP